MNNKQTNSRTSPVGRRSWSATLRVLDQYIAPHHFLTHWMQRLTRIRSTWFKNLLIKWFMRHYAVDMSIAAEANPGAYPEFNSFFTRALKPGARPIVNANDAIACPADGVISQLGDVKNGRLLQAKGYYFNLLTLLGGSETRARTFNESRFVTIYLSPRDYHRVHMPLSGRLRETIYIPGRLFSVSPRTTRAIQGLFARNERYVSIFDTAIGPVAVILVGAMFVAGIETVWSGLLPHGNQIIEHQFEPGLQQEEISLERGDELGRFNMGSTVIVLFPPGRVEFAPALTQNAPVKMGEHLGSVSL